MDILISYKDQQNILDVCVIDKSESKFTYSVGKINMCVYQNTF